MITGATEVPNKSKCDFVSWRKSVSDNNGELLTMSQEA